MSTKGYRLMISRELVLKSTFSPPSDLFDPQDGSGVF